jgi:hypothetical protein
LYIIGAMILLCCNLDVLHLKKMFLSPDCKMLESFALLGPFSLSWISGFMETFVREITVIFIWISCLTLSDYAGATWEWSYSNLAMKGVNPFSKPCGITQMQ